MIEYFSAHIWQAWTLVALVCLILELTNGDFFIVCFSIGAVCAAVASAFTDSLTAQILVFAITSVLSLFFVRPKALKYLHRDEDERQSNADALIGRTGRVSEAIPAEGYGRVAIDGDDWKATSTVSTELPAGAKVRVVSMDSIIITVEPV